MDYKAIFDKFSNYKILVIGDVMLDDYIVGSVSRISPEAPVPVVDIAQRYARLGGAANVAFNIKAMGSTAILCSVVGTCKKSDTFIQLLQKENMPIDGIVRSQDRKMTVKYRVLGNNVQLLRMDDEEKDELSLQDRQALLAKIKHYITTEKNIAIVFEDYDKGVISSALIDEVVAMAQQYQVPITVDPKKRNFLHYHHIDIFKPNWKELREGLQLDKTELDDEVLANVRQFMQQKNHKHLLLTMSEKGVLMAILAGEELQLHRINAIVRNVADVSGAGDTTIAVATLCLAAGMDAQQIAALSNLAGGIVCEEVGVVTINKEKLLSEANRLY